ncbi:hypothetical protein [Actinoplanes sp. NPDC049599]|uniref:hypothetical protein n=1 Tax=Actinoplanes sp. NPDC049599 TaxID=3363903 RepID=UPI0037A55CD8
MLTVAPGSGAVCWWAAAITIFRRPVRRPAVWASALICLGVSSLLRSANYHDLPPAAWEDPIRFLDLTLTIAFVVLMIVSPLNPTSARRRP